MRRRDLDNLLEQAVADALGLDRNADFARPSMARLRPTRRPQARSRTPMIITTSHRRVAQHA